MSFLNYLCLLPLTNGCFFLSTLSAQSSALCFCWWCFFSCRTLAPLISSMWTSRLQPPIELRVQPKVGERLCLCGLHFAFCFCFCFYFVFIVYCCSARAGLDGRLGTKQGTSWCAVTSVLLFGKFMCRCACACVCVCVSNVCISACVRVCDMYICVCVRENVYSYCVPEYVYVCARAKMFARIEGTVRM